MSGYTIPRFSNLLGISRQRYGNLPKAARRTGYNGKNKLIGVEVVLTLPTLLEAQAMLAEGGQMNPGGWVAHSQFVAQAAERLAARLPGLDPQRCHIFGLLHDIGRRFGIAGMRHVRDGYHFLAQRGFAEAARICLTHSYPLPDARWGSDRWDGSAEEYEFVQTYLKDITYTDEDRLLQLCDALALPSGFCLIEKRLLDVTLRYGFSAFTIDKWKAILQIQKDFEAKLGQSIYDLLPGVVENTFASRIY